MYEPYRCFLENIKHELCRGSDRSHDYVGETVVSYASKEISLFYVVRGINQAAVSFYIS